jgi:hypothetical protein
MIVIKALIWVNLLFQAAVFAGPVPPGAIKVRYALFSTGPVESVFYLEDFPGNRFHSYRTDGPSKSDLREPLRIFISKDVFFGLSTEGEMKQIFGPRL